MTTVNSGTVKCEQYEVLLLHRLLYVNLQVSYKLSCSLIRDKIITTSAVGVGADSVFVGGSR